MCGQKGCSIFWCFLYFISGFALLGVGIWTPVDDRVFDSISARRPGLMDSKVPWRGWVGGLIALGSYTVLVGILGMAGSACDLDEKIKNSLIAFAVFASFGTIGCLILGAISTAGFATTDKGEYFDDLKVALRDTYTDQITENDFKKAWNRYQINSKCCGVDSYADYRLSELANSTTNPADMEVAWSCCVLKDGVETLYPKITDAFDAPRCQLETDFDTAGPPVANGDGRHDKGCGQIMWDRYRQWQTAVMAMSWTATGVQIIALIVSGCLKKDAIQG